MAGSFTDWKQTYLQLLLEKNLISICPICFNHFSNCIVKVK